MHKSIRKIFGLLIILIVLTIIGYFAFRVFATETQKIFSYYSIYLVALIAGVATFFSPCSFGLLPAYLTFYTKTAKKRKTFYYGFLAALGLITFNMLLGVIIAFGGAGIAKAFSISGGGTLSPVTIFIRIIIGSLLLYLGIAQFFHIFIFPKFLLNIGQKIIQRKRSPEASFYFYGFGYNLANVGCTGPIMAGLILFALTTGFYVALTAFVIYSFTMALLMIIISYIVSSGKKLYISNQIQNIQKFGSIVLMIVGLFILWTVVFSPTFIKIFFP